MDYPPQYWDIFGPDDDLPKTLTLWFDTKCPDKFEEFYKQLTDTGIRIIQE